MLGVGMNSQADDVTVLRDGTWPGGEEGRCLQTDLSGDLCPIERS